MIILQVSCSGGVKPSAKAPPLPSGTDMALSDGVKFTEVIEGELTWQINSDRATYSTGSGVLDFYDVNAAYFRQSKPAYTVSGRKGSYDSKKEIIRLEGDIRGSTSDGYTIKTESLQYSLETETAETPDYVEIRGRGLEMEGVGMVADFKTEVFRLLDNVRVRAVPGEISR